MDPLPDPASDAGNIPISQSDQSLDSARDKSDQLNQSRQSKTDDASLPLSSAATPAGVSGIAKELESGGLPPSEQLRPATPDIEVPKEVAGAGIKIQPTTIPLPPNVAHMGIKPAGTNIPANSSQTVNLPLSEDQIAQGLHQSIVSSWRWLAEWCIRRLKQMHVGLKTIHGKLTKGRTQ
jgi:hypothetical protein